MLRYFDGRGRERPKGSIALSGRVNGNGTIAAGSGFSVNRTGAGQYTITFTTPLANVPVVIANLINAHTQDNQSLNVSAPATTGFTLTTVLVNDGSAGFTDYAFNFMVMEPQ